ncbi:MAG: TonB-dependent receptor [Ignavibacteriaceae bacterium]|jgi:outer membrane receptor protein involved in Fe transport
MKVKYIIGVIAFILFFSHATFAQFSLSGTVSDRENNEKLIGAVVTVKALGLGAVTNEKGEYRIENLPKGTYEVAVAYIGYVAQLKNFNVNNNLVVEFSLNSAGVLLGETVVKGTRAVLRETPVAFTEVEGAALEFKLASRDVPQMLITVPNVYSSVGGGGAGDANLYVRGFNQRDIAIMINGVPVNDMENGWVYWSNWAGLGDVTSSIQVQRGLGASPYSVNSIGGVINITTLGVGSRKEFVRYKSEFGSDKLEKSTVAFGTNFGSNIGMTALFSRKKWDGYVQQTPLDEFTYFFSIGGVWSNHSLEFSAVASPQEHGQRFSRQSIATWNTRGFNFNANYGLLNNEVVWEGYNKFHKPQFNLNWNWQISKATTLSNVAYVSIGNGWGTGSIGSNYTRRVDGTIDWDAVYAKNTTTIDTLYSKTQKKSVTALRHSVNNHFWVGILSTIKHQLNENINLNFGIDGRYYKGEHYREISNLIGGDYYLDKSNKNNPANMAKIGDKVAYYNDGLVRQIGGFGQAEYKEGKISTFLNVSLSNTGFNRIDHFNFLESDPLRETGYSSFMGYTLKTGLNFNIDDHNSIFGNVGYFSRAPIFDNVFNFANNKYQDIKNEKILGIEAGYNLNTPTLAVMANGYYTSWKDKAISRSVTNPTTGNTFYYNLTGAAQLHVGGELQAIWKADKKLEVEGSFSYAQNKFKNDVTAIIAPEDDPTKETKVNSYVDGLYVGDFPMTNASLQFTYTENLSNGTTFYFNPIYSFHGRFYSFFNPDQRTNINDRSQSYRLPDYYILDLHAGFDFLFTEMFFKKLNVGLHMFNALNNLDYIVDGQDGSDHSKNTALVFMGRSRWYNFSLTFDF